ncbi:MAG: ATP-dependent helicase DinG [Bacilli bacterium]|nr:ATP-dependent helicase DinG [Bacilli bacterium]
MSSYVALDLETTGLRHKEDQILEVGLVKVINGEIVDTFECLLKQTKPLPASIIELTGISEDDLQSASDLSDVLPAVLTFVEGFDLVAHNGNFDLAFLQRALDDNGYAELPNFLIDTIDFAQLAFPKQSSFSLSNLAKQLELSHSRPHRALSDAVATHHLYQHALKRLSAMSQAVLDLLHQVAHMSGWRYAHILSELHTSAEFGERLVLEEECTVIQGLAHRPVRWQTFDQTREIVASPAEIIVQGGPLSSLHPHYEERPAQLQMMEQVQQAFAEDKHLIVEAGTGTGKSMAYLVPAIYHAVTHQQKVVIATHTLHLQEQLKDRDLPLLSSVIPFPFQAAVLKGRNNYICMRKVTDGLMTLGMLPDDDQLLFYLRLVTWLVQTDAGDREELQMLGTQSDSWNKVQSDTNSCLSRQCPFFKNCYYYRARGSAAASDVIIANHSLLLTDIKAESQILPEYDYLVIDEAHHLEDEATKHLGDEVSYWSMLNPINRLARDRRSGLLASLEHFASVDQNTGNQLFTGLLELSVSAIQTAYEMRDSIEAFFMVLTRFVEDHADGSGMRTTLRFKPEHVRLPSWNSLTFHADEIESRLKGLRELVSRMEPFCEILGAQQMIQGLVTDITGQVKELDRGYSSIQSFLIRAEDPTGSVLWVDAEERAGRYTATMYSAPLHVGKLLQQSLFGSKSSVILTSATLSINHSFNYMLERLGFKEPSVESKLLTLEVDSPFDYKKQSIVCIPTDTLSLKQSSHGDYVKSISESIVMLARITSGRMLVLFTSHSMLRETAEIAQPGLLEHGITLLAQGVTPGSRYKLVFEFQSTPKAVLFGANSFWEGVDIPGEDLSCLVIVRLPFSPPSQPIVEARTESLERSGKNAFMEYSVPQAIVRFKQGFGRVIRSQRDIGAIVVYDRRVIDARYGRLFLQSLPDPWVYQGPEKEVWKVVYNWLKKERSS